MEKRQFARIYLVLGTVDNLFCIVMVETEAALKKLRAEVLEIC